MSKGCTCCCQQFARKDYINVLTVTDSYVTDEFPYPRCGDREGDTCPNSCGGGAGDIQCGPWPESFVPTTAGGHILANENLFDASETAAIVEAICPSTGHKVSQSTKQWHGVLPFNFCPDGCTTNSAKYLTISITISGALRDNDDFCNSVKVYDETRTWTVNRYSGEITASTHCNSWIRVQTSPGVWENITPLSVDTLPFYTVPDVCDGDSVPAMYDFYRTQSDSISADISIGATGIEWHTVNAVTPTPGQCDPLANQEYVTGGGQLITSEFDVVVVYSGAYTSTNVSDDCKNAMSFWELKNHLLLPFRTDTWRTVGVISKYKEKGETSPASGPDNCETVDDYLSPIGSPPYSSWNQRAWFDPDAYVWIFAAGEDSSTAAATELRLIYDGSIIGKPFTPGDGGSLVSGLPDRMWGWQHKTWGCYSDMSGDHNEVRWYGAESGANGTLFDATDAVIPTSASLWTEQIPAGDYPPGLWVIWTGLDYVTMQKQCEQVVSFPAFNLFGPCGYFRHVMDYGIADCISATTGSEDWVAGDVITTLDDLTNVGRAGGHISAGDKVVLGSTNTDSFKIFVVAVAAAGAITLGAEDTDARNVKDAYTLWTNNTVPTGTYGFIGKLRIWKRSMVAFIPPAICGKIAATVAQDIAEPTKVKVTFAQKYTAVGDKIIFVQSDDADTVNDDNSGSGFTLTDAADDSCKFTGTYNATTMKGYVKILGAPLAKWNSVAPRKTFVWIECPPDGATGDFDAPTNHDDSYTGTKTVLGCTPNSDLAANECKTTSYPAGTGFPFPSTPTPSTCGGKSLVLPLQFIRHPLVETPFTCGDPIDPICLPKVEAFTQGRMDDYVSAGAPALPDGVTLDIPASAPSAVGYSCDAPTLLPNGSSSPWSLCTP